MKTLLSKRHINILKSEPDLLITLFIAPFFILLMFFLKPFVHIRVGLLHCDRLGHFTVNTELYTLEKNFIHNKIKKRSIDFLYLPWKTSCNKTLENLWRRKLIILPRFILRPICLIIRSFNFLKDFRCGVPTNSDRDVLNLIEKFPPSLKFSEKEEEFGKLELKKLGIEENYKFVCVTFRDSSYVDQIHLKRFSKHDYRDSDIQNFLLAAEELTKRGYYVIRMGAVVNQPFKTSNEKIIDYAYKGLRTDFMDIYLGAKCEFCVTTGTGFDGVPMIFRRPLVYVSFSPLFHIHIESEFFTFIPKHHYSKKLERRLTAKEIINSDCFYYLSMAEFIKNNIELEENSPEEIRDVVLEMHKKINNEEFMDDEDKNLQTKFWDIFPNQRKYSGNIYYGKRKSTIGSKFLRENQWWLE